MEERIGSLDAARGFAILAVVASHGLLLQGGAAAWIYEFYVPLFFVIAGYLGAPRRLGKRLAGLASKYLGVCAVLFLLWFLLWPLRGQQRDLVPRALYSILYGRFWDPAHPYLTNTCWCGQLWFFTLLCTATALFALLLPLARKGPVWAAALLAVLLGAAQLLRAAPVLLPWCLDTAPLAAAYMLAGRGLARLDLARLDLARLDLARRPWRGAGLPLLAVCLAAYLALHDTYDLNLRVYGRWEDWRGTLAFFAAGTAGSALCLAACTLLCRVPVLGRVLTCAGRHSMAIFCWHIFWIWLADDLRARLPDFGTPESILYALFLLAGVPLLSLATDRLYTGALARLRRLLPHPQ